MNESECPASELLSGYVDRALNPSEEKRVVLHLADCGACRAQLRSFGRLKISIRNQPVPPMPAGLKAELLRMAREADAERSAKSRAGKERGLWASLKLLVEAMRALFAQAPRLSTAAAALILGLAVWGGWRLRATPERVKVPVDFILAAHHQYVRTLPLAPTEKIMTELPIHVSYAGSEEAGDVRPEVY